MPRPTKRRQARSAQATDFLLNLQAADDAGSAVRHGKNVAGWQFIDHRRYECPSEEKRYLLEYELAREAHDLGIRYRSAATWRLIFGDQFPETPFLSIDPVNRHKLLTAAFLKSKTVVPLFDFTTEWQGLAYQFDYPLLPEYQNRLNDVIAGARGDIRSESWERALNAAILEFMASLPETAYDLSVANVRMTIHFDRSDDVLKAAFADLLSSVRKVESIPGQKDELDARLKQLAVARLHRIFGTVEASQDYLADCGFDLPYADASGWSKARTATRKLLGVTTTEETTDERE